MKEEGQSIGLRQCPMGKGSKWDVVDLHSYFPGAYMKNHQHVDPTCFSAVLDPLFQFISYGAHSVRIEKLYVLTVRLMCA